MRKVEGVPITPQDDFNEIAQLITAARQRAVQAVNTSLVELYWQRWGKPSVARLHRPNGVMAW